MSKSLVRFLSRLLVICMIGLPFQAHAGLIGTSDVVSAAQAVAARDTVATFMNRSDVAGQLQALGLNAKDAQQRVAALTDAEVANLAGQIDRLPAGADGGSLLLLIVLGVLIWWLVKK